MDWAYPGHGVISKKNRKLFEAWDKEDPVDEWECERCRRIEGIQGNENPFVKKVCVERGCGDVIFLTFPGILQP